MDQKNAPEIIANQQAGAPPRESLNWWLVWLGVFAANFDIGLGSKSEHGVGKVEDLGTLLTLAGLICLWVSVGRAGVKRDWEASSRRRKALLCGFAAIVFASASFSAFYISNRLERLLPEDPGLYESQEMREMSKPLHEALAKIPGGEGLECRAFKDRETGESRTKLTLRSSAETGWAEASLAAPSGGGSWSCPNEAWGFFVEVGGRAYVGRSSWWNVRHASAFKKHWEGLDPAWRAKRIHELAVQVEASRGHIEFELKKNRDDRVREEERLRLREGAASGQPR